MHFNGFIVLPEHGSLTLFDYLTIADNSLFLTAVNSGDMYKVSIDGRGQVLGSTISELAGNPSVHGVAVVQSPHLAFITRSRVNTVDVFNPSTLQRITSIPVANDPDGIIYDPVSHLIYVTNGEAKLATLIDPVKLITVGTIRLPGRPEYPAVDTGTGLLYQNLTDTNSLAAIDLTKRLVVGTWSLAPCEGPSSMAIDPLARRLFSVCMRNATLVVFDLDQHQIVASVKIGRLSDSVAFDSTYHRLYTANADGTMTIVQQDAANSYRVLDTIRTHLLTHTLVVDPVSHSVYVAYTGLLMKPRIAVFSPVK